MARHKEFNPTAVLDIAVKVFQEKGYRGTSMRDLLARMGINRGSFYDTFGSKREVFLAALNRFIELEINPYVERLQEPSKPPENRLRDYVAYQTTLATEQRPPHGCFLTKAAMETAPSDAEVETLMVDIHMEVLGVFQEVIRAAQRRGTIPPEANAENLSFLLLATVHSMRVMSSAGATADTIKAIGHSVLWAMGLPPEYE